MPPPTPITITIPDVSTATDPKPHTLYNIKLVLPLRTLTLPKRYSDFVALNTEITSQASTAPPEPLPPKTWFGSSSTVSNPSLAEDRRQKLETYVQSIQNADDSRWRDTSAWRTFLNLPAGSSIGPSSSANSSTSTLPNTNTNTSILSTEPVTDPNLWLTVHRTLKSYLHSARLSLAARDQATSIQGTREASAAAKASLVRAAAVHRSLDEGLQTMAGPRGNGNGNSSSGILPGEMRRRKDMLASARRERDGLESLLILTSSNPNNKFPEGENGSSPASGLPTNKDKEKLIGRGPHPQSGRRPAARVLGKETEQTRELDNEGLLQLQQQVWSQQDVDIEALRKNVSTMKQLGVAIGDEMEVQNEMLGLLGEDVERVDGKMRVARRRIKKIS
ncbi:MAG: hypothetical protein M1834_000975 [Cirrosporium novae-zelandiae]|nr:MAG: hypothetical protein M1834_000975 [Cirrosporium novae-zelandiae]